MTTTVLVAEDEQSLADAHARWLEEHEVRVANDGEEALDALDETVDVVLLDRRMPGLSGDEVIEEIRDRGIDVRVAMVTAVEPDFDVVDMPFDDYLVKPVDREQLRDAVEQLSTLSDYDEQLRELYALSRKKAALEASKGEAALEESEEYRSLERRIEEAVDRTYASLDEFADEVDPTALYR